MAIIEFVLLDFPYDMGVYAIFRSITNKSTIQLRKRVANSTAFVKWDTDNFPLTLKREQNYEQIKSSLEKLSSSSCKYQLF